MKAFVANQSNIVYHSCMVSLNDIRNEFQRLDAWSNGVLDAIAAGNLEKAETLCEKLARYYPEMLDQHERLARVREAQGRFEEAILLYDKAIAMVEEKPDTFGHEELAYLKELRQRVQKRIAGGS
jgi:tetratricopeptide (TPR) repeat protein